MYENYLPANYEQNGQNVTKTLSNGDTRACRVQKSTQFYESDFITFGRVPRRYYLNFDQMCESPRYFVGINDEIRAKLLKAGFMKKSRLTDAVFFKKKFMKEDCVISAHGVYHHIPEKSPFIKIIRDLYVDEQILIPENQTEVFCAQFKCTKDQLNVAEFDIKTLEPFLASINFDIKDLCDCRASMTSLPHAIDMLKSRLMLDEPLIISEELLLNDNYMNSEKMRVVCNYAFNKRFGDCQAGRLWTSSTLRPITKTGFCKFYGVHGPSTDISNMGGDVFYELTKSDMSYSDQIDLLKLKHYNINPKDVVLLRFVKSNILKLVLC